MPLAIAVTILCVWSWSHSMSEYNIKFSDEFGAFPAQARYVDGLFGPEQHYAIGYVGGWGSGKTKALAVAAVIASSLNPGLPGMVVSPTYGMLADATYPAIIDVLEDAGIPYRTIKSPQWNIHILPWDGHIWCRSGEKPERLKGPNVAFGFVDEGGSVKEAAWLVLQSRIRHPKAKRLVRGVATTPEGFNWVYDDFGCGKTGNVLINAPTTDNKALPPNYVTQLLEGMDELHARAYIYGEFCSLYQQQVYYNFNRELHLEPVVYNRDEAIIWTHDFNVHPMCSVILQLHGHQTLYAVDEIVVPSSNTPEVSKEFVSRYKKHRGLIHIMGDPAGRARDTRQESARSDFDIIYDELDRGLDYATLNVDISRKHPSLKRRHNTVNALLKNAFSKVNFYLNPETCPGLMASFERTVRKEGTQIVDKATEWKWGRHRFVGVEHSTDAAGYAACQLFRDPAEIRSAA